VTKSFAIGQFEAFDWDIGNLAKCQKHGVTIADIEWVMKRDPLVGRDAQHSAHEERLRAIGQTAVGRWIFVVFTMRRRDGHSLVRPISARPMHAKEIKNYEEGTSSTEAISDPADR
jgi:uncharacterized DUF497 family protein